MVYHGTSTSETILFHPIGRPRQFYFLELTKAAAKPTFFVTSCCGNEWYYEFYMENNSDYERVKLAIMDAIFECEDMEELLDHLSEIFEDGFDDILVEDDNEYDCECDFNCDNCECNKYLN
jgi:hypothetical protein